MQVDTMMFGEKVERRCKAAAKKIVRDVREELGMRRGAFRRAYRSGDTAVMALISIKSQAAGLDIDPERLREILMIILEFIKAFMLLF
jgi:hypothetical protein